MDTPVLEEHMNNKHRKLETGALFILIFFWIVWAIVYVSLAVLVVWLMLYAFNIVNTLPWN